MHTTEQLNVALEGRYIIQRVVGEGGMATVFLARDVKHNRNVALKVLKPDLGAIVGVERFLAEIEVTANLQHPNLLPLFDSGATDGVLFYVMPYVEGETLRARLDREKQLPVDEVVRIVSAIASALDYAHRHDVIHRDLKPENILLHDGQPLVADFGIALAVSKAGGNRITQTGLSLGTPQYMSPEQATGDRTVDARTDIYSLGAVTYEMLTGEAPHIGSTSQAVIARVLTERPRPVRSSRPSVPEHIEYAVEHALEKLPADRFASAKAFSDALASPAAMTAMASRGAANTRDAVPVRAAYSRVLAALPWALAVVASAAAAWAWRPQPEAPLVAARFTIELPDDVRIAPRNVRGGFSQSRLLDISPDGTKLAVVATKPDGSTAVFLRRLGDPIAGEVRGTDGATHASFSPDGDALLIIVAEQLRAVPVIGGRATVLADSAGYAHWGEGDRVVFANGGGVWLTTSNGGEARAVIRREEVPESIVSLTNPEILPGGTHALVTIARTLPVPDSMFLAVIALEDGALTELNLAGFSAHYVPSGQLLFARPGGEVYVAPFSLRSRTVTGPAALLLQEVQQNRVTTDFAVAHNGTLVYRSGAQFAMRLRYMAMVDREGGERALMGEAAVYSDPRVSPDGRLVAYNLSGVSNAPQGSGDVFVDGIATGVRSRISNTETSTRPEWSADGTHVYWIDQTGDDSTFVRLRPWDRPGAGVIVARSTGNGPEALQMISVGPPRGWAAFRIGDAGTNPDVWAAPIDSLDARRPLANTPYEEFTPAVSPDGRLVAYASRETGRLEIYVTTFPTPGARIVVSVGGGTEPAWSRDGQRLFFRGARRMMEATITERPTLAVTRVDSLFEDRYARQSWHRQYDVHPNGQFLMLGWREEAPTGENNLYAVVNWPSLLRTGSNGR